MWRFVDEPWQYRVLDRLSAGIDQAQLEQNLKLTPTQRLEAVMALMEVGEALQRSLGAKKSAP